MSSEDYACYVFPSGVVNYGFSIVYINSYGRLQSLDSFMYYNYTSLYVIERRKYDYICSRLYIIRIDKYNLVFIWFILSNVEVHIMLAKNLTSHDWEKLRKRFYSDQFLKSLKKDLSNLQSEDFVNLPKREKLNKFWSYAPTGLIFAIGTYVFEENEEIKQTAFEIFNTIFTDYSDVVEASFVSDEHTKKYETYYEALRNLRAINWIDRLGKLAEDKRYDPFIYGGLMFKADKITQSDRVLNYISNPDNASKFSNLEIAELLLIASNISTIVKAIMDAKILAGLETKIKFNKEMNEYSETMFHYIRGENIDAVKRVDTCINVENPIVTAFCLYIINSPDIIAMEEMRFAAD